MSLYRRKRKKQEITNYVNFAPFVDILFSLLIVFIVATPMTLGGVKIDLPVGKAQVVIVKKEPLVISIIQDGTIFLEKEQVKLNSLSTKLSELTMGEKDIKIFIKADKNIVYNRVISVVSSVYSAGFYDVTLVTELKKL